MYCVWIIVSVSVNFRNFRTVTISVWKLRKFTLTEYFFRQITYLVISLVKVLLSRNFCQKKSESIVWKLLKSTLKIFWQKFRESNRSYQSIDFTEYFFCKEQISCFKHCGLWFIQSCSVEKREILSHQNFFRQIK